MDEVEKINLSLDDIIRIQHLEKTNAEVSSHGFVGRSRSRSRSYTPSVRARSSSCTRSASCGRRSRSRTRNGNNQQSQQWRLENYSHSSQGRSRSRSRHSSVCRSNSRTPSVFSLPATTSWCKNQSYQSPSFHFQRPYSAQYVRRGNRPNPYIRRHSFALGRSVSSTPVSRVTPSFQQLRLAQQKVRLAKRILNARRKLYRRQLRAFEELLDDSVVIGGMNWSKQRTSFPATVHRNISTFNHSWKRQPRMVNLHQHQPLSVTFQNELARRICGSRQASLTGEEMVGASQISTTETLNEAPGLRINGGFVRSPHVGNMLDNDTVHVCTKGKMIKTVVNNSTVVPNADVPQFMDRSSPSTTAARCVLLPPSAFQTLNQRFSAYQVECLE